MPHFMIVLILYVNLLNLSWIKKMSIFEEYGTFNLLSASQSYISKFTRSCYELSTLITLLIPFMSLLSHREVHFNVDHADQS